MDLSPSAPPLLFDSHMHTPMCHHAVDEPELYAEKALARGLKGIIFTCHSPLPNQFHHHVRMNPEEFETYLALIERCRKAFEGRLEVRLGLESDYFPGLLDWLKELHQRASFDYILGSVHYQSQEYLSAYGTLSDDEFVAQYFEFLAESAECGLFDSLGHADLVKNHVADTWQFERARPVIEKALDRIAKTGVAMEINTSGVNKRYAEMNPSLEMLKLMKARGIRVVLGSDSHRSRRVGDGFEQALGYLAQAGYDEIWHFKQRQAIRVNLEEGLASLRLA